MDFPDSGLLKVPWKSTPVTTRSTKPVAPSKKVVEVTDHVPASDHWKSALLARAAKKSGRVNVNAKRIFS